jgi:hypothetical protein
MNTGCALFLAGFCLLALIVVVAQATEGWMLLFALIVFPVWFLLRRRWP